MVVREIPIEKLFHHPNNPRSEYKDIEELTKSISEQGIIQPLTVVRIATGYNVVAGNRRMEAARKAGLDTCPCIVSDMDEKTQATVILVENMQRKNLNPYEECKGVQLCLDLGMNEKEISKRTGFSKETIRHRKKMAELDPEKLKKKCEDGQITLKMLIDLEKIKDPQKRNEVLEEAGTNNFGWKLSSAIREEEYEEEREIAYKILCTFAEEMPDGWADSEYLKIKSNFNGEFEVPDDAKTADYAFRRSWPRSHYYDLYKWKGDIDDSKEEEPQKDQQSSRRDECQTLLKDLGETLFSMRKEHIKSMDHFSGNIMQWMAYCLVGDNFDEDVEKPEGFPWNESVSGWNCGKIYHEVMGSKDNCDYETIIKGIGMDNINKPIAAPILIYSMLETGERISCATWRGEFDALDEAYARLYAFMELCGYKLSDVEKKILDGTHEAYYRKEEE